MCVQVEMTDRTMTIGFSLSWLTKYSLSGRKHKFYDLIYCFLWNMLTLFAPIWRPHKNWESFPYLRQIDDVKCSAICLAEIRTMRLWIDKQQLANIKSTCFSFSFWMVLCYDITCLRTHITLRDQIHSSLFIV